MPDVSAGKVIAIGIKSADLAGRIFEMGVGERECRKREMWVLGRLRFYIILHL